MPADAAIGVAFGIVLVFLICVAVVVILCRTALRRSAYFKGEVQAATFRLYIETGSRTSEELTPRAESAGEPSRRIVMRRPA